YIFDYETSAAQSAQQIVPTMQVFQGARFAMHRAFRRCWQRARAIIRLGNSVSLSELHIGLQAGGLLVLTDVETSGRQDTRDFAIDSVDVADVAGAHRLD